MNKIRHFVRSRLFRSSVTEALLMIFLLPLLVPLSTVSAQSGDVGYRDFPFPAGTGGATRGPTGEKPESKLWWVGGVWYGSLWSQATNAFTIHRFNLGSQSWTSTGVKIDDRLGSKADALWDGTKLYIASHLYIENAAAPAPAGQRGELYRYSYNATTKAFSLDTGFPVEITRGKSETLVIDKDSSGRLWVTYVESNKVMVNHSLNGSDLQWGTPFILPAGGMETVNKDDISSLISYKNFIGVMWSRQTSPLTIYFAVHPVGAPDTNWTRVRSYTISADDHVNLKTLESDSAGNIFAVIKTNNNSALIMVLVCRNNINSCQSESDWVSYSVYNTASGSPTRPILIIDESNRHLYVFVRNEPTGTTRGGIYYKRTNLDNISFNPSDIGTPFINNSVDFQVDDATSTKQNVTSASGLLILASDPHSGYYLHNYIALGGSPPAPPTISGFTPASGPPGAEVTVSGTNFNGTTSVTFNNNAALTFTVDSATSLRAVVPTNATSGAIHVTTPNGTAASSTSFTVTAAPTYTLNASAQGSGSVLLSPPGGVYNQGTVVSLTATPNPGWLFTGWLGSLTGSANPANLTMNANYTVTAVFNEQTGGVGAVTHQGTVTGGAVAASAVSTPATVGGSGLFLAAVSTRSSSTVSSVSGLGLTWTRVLRQCAGRSISMVEVWMAQGAPSSSGAVTAQFGAAFKSASIAVSSYTGVSTTQPLGAPIGANTLGLNGACTGGTDSSSYSFNLATTNPGSVVYAAASMRNRTHNPGAGYTERAETQAGLASDMTSLAVQDKTVASAASTPVNGTFSGAVDWSVIGIEIRASSGSEPPPNPSPTITGFTPTSGPVGTEVTVSGSNFTGTSAVSFNNSPAQSFTVDSATSLRAVVPSGASSGAISVTSPNGTATSSGSFTVTTTPPPTFTLSVTVQGSGSVSLSPPGGVYNQGTVVSLAATAQPGWLFTSWQGDLSGSANPATLTMDANKAITAVFTAQPSGGGSVIHEGTVTGTGLAASTVSTGGNVVGAGTPGLYLAAVSTRNSLAADSVSGLGLTWTRVLRQCTGRSISMVDLWMALGTPAADGPVTAQFGVAFKSAVIAVSRYSGARAVGAPVGANSLGVNGACAGGIDSSSYAFNLTTTTPGAVLYAAASMRNRTHSPGAGYTERSETLAGSAGDVSSIAVQDQAVTSASSTSVNGAFSGTIDWAVIGVEILPN